MENKFLNRVSELIDDKNARALINAELESHLLDKIDYYTEIGYTSEEAQKKATEEMGSPDDTAVPLNSLHKGSVLKNIFIILSVLVIIALLLFGNTHSDSFGYANNSLDNPHYIKYDFLSLLIFTVYSLLLYISHKRRIKQIPAIMLGSFVIQIWFTLTTNFLFQESIFVSDVTTLFQPLAYAAVMIVTSGFSGYIDSIFSYSFIPLASTGTAIYKGAAILLFVILLVWTVAVYFEISRQEKMKPTRIFRNPLNLAQCIISVLLSINLITMTIGTVIAYNGLDRKIADTAATRRNMIDCVLNADKYADCAELIGYLSESWYEVTQDIQFDLHDTLNQPYIYLDGSNMLELIDENDYVYIDVKATTTQNSLVEQALLCDYSDYSELATYNYGTSLSEFMKSALYTKAYEVERFFSVTADWSDRVYFHFRFDESADYDFVFLTFENGVLNENTLQPYIGTIKSERQEIIEYIVTDSFLDKYYAVGDDGLSERLDKLENQGFRLDDVSADNIVKRCQNDDDYNRIILESNSNTGAYYFKYYSTKVDETNIAANQGLYFDEDEFDSFEIGMCLEDFIKLSNNYYWSNAGCVTSRAVFDSKKEEYTDRTVRFVYAIDGSDENVSGVVYKYVLEFENGVLTEKYSGGLFSDVYKYEYY